MCLILSPGSQSEGSILLSGRGCGRISLVVFLRTVLIVEGRDLCIQRKVRVESVLGATQFSKLHRMGSSKLGTPAICSM